MLHIAMPKITGSEEERKQRKRLVSLKFIVQIKGDRYIVDFFWDARQLTQSEYDFRVIFRDNKDMFFEYFTELIDCYLIHEQPTLEMISVGSATQATSNLKRSFSIALIIFS